MGKEPSIDLSKLTEEERDYVLSLQRELADKRLESASREAKLREAESKIAASERKIRAYEKALMFGSDNPIDGLDTLGNPMYEAYLRNKVKLPGRLYHNLMYRNAQKLFKIPLK